jgi:hypothetical protein
MNKTVYRVATTALFLSFSGCSTYDSIAPDWAKVGSSETENVVVVTEAADDNAETTWWNPLTWW